MSEVELGGGAFLGVVILGLLSGTASILVIRQFTDAVKLKTAADLIIAYLFEFRLFAEEPSLIVRAQWNLLVANARLMRLVALPSLILVVPFWALFSVADALYGRAALKPGAATTVTVQYRKAGTFEAGDASLEAPAGFTVETPAVKSAYDRQVCWRVRARNVSSGRLLVRQNGRSLAKSISSRGYGFSETRARFSSSLLFHPTEIPFSDPAIEWIQVRYPSATIFSTHWIVWFSLGSLLGAAASALRS